MFSMDQIYPFSSFQCLFNINSFFVILIILIMLYIFKLYKNFVIYSNIINKIPGPIIRNSLIGNIDTFYASENTKDWFEETYNTLLDLCNTFRKDGVFRFWLGPFHPALILLNADNVKILLSTRTNTDKSYHYQFLRPWIGFSLLISTYKKWHKTRKLLNPTFHFKILEDFLPTIIRQENIMFSLIDKQMAENNGIIDDIRPLITNYSLDVICETAMGVTVSAQTNPNSAYTEAIRKVLRIIVLRFIKPWLWSDFLFNFSLLGRNLRKRVAILHSFTDSVIKERKLEKLNNFNKLHKNTNELNSKGFDSTNKTFCSNEKQVFLDLLIDFHLKNPEEMCELDMRSEVDTFMAAGHDSTSYALIFALILIGQNTNIQAKIHEELDKTFSNDMNRGLTLDDLRELKYLEQCIKEALRLYPPAQIIARHITEPIRLSTGQYIPSGTTCCIPIISVHKDPKYFPNPDVFDPDRFETAAMAHLHPFAYIPFSAGPRNCIGQKFALLEIKATLATIFRKYRIQTLLKESDFCVNSAPNSILKRKLKMKFELRNQLK